MTFGPPCPPCKYPDDCPCEWGVIRQQERGVKPAPGDRCFRCMHTRGVHKLHCCLESGCQCKEFF